MDQGVVARAVLAAHIGRDAGDWIDAAALLCVGGHRPVPHRAGGIRLLPRRRDRVPIPVVSLGLETRSLGLVSVARLAARFASSPGPFRSDGGTLAARARARTVHAPGRG